MKFYDREKEIDILRKNWEKSSKKSLFTVLIGRRRIGKTALLLKTEQEQEMHDARLLQEKFESIKSFFGKYKETKLVGLSMEDM